MTTETSIYEYAKQGLALSADKPAIWFYGKSITYRELFEKIDNVADHLYALGVREGTVVTIHLPNCPQAVMAIYAVAKLGGICNMVHALIPEAALREHMAFTESEFLITHLIILGGNTICLGSFAGLEEPCDCVAVIPEQCDLAEKCVLYLHSSGTTGEPKIVMHCHAAMNRIVANTFKLLHCTDFTDQVVLAELPLFHGFGLIDNLHDVIAGGGQLIQMTRWDSRLAAEWIDEYRVTFMAGVPKFYYDLLEEPTLKGSSLTHCYVGGDSVDSQLKRRFNQRMGRESLLYEGYGMAEVLAYCCSCSPYVDKIESSGKAMPGTKLAVLSGDNILPDGEGELLVSSNTMMLGYLRGNDDGFLIRNEEKWIRTGDYVRLAPDGYLYYIERLKNLIVRNGYNVFPSVVESLARRLEWVREVCVLGVKTGTTQTITAVVAAEERKDGRNLLFKIWKENLPPYAIPSEIRFVDHIPYSANGKIDRFAVWESYGND